MTEVEKLYYDILYGRVYLCDKCRRRNMDCKHRDCMKECERMVNKDKEKDEQIPLF